MADSLVHLCLVSPLGHRGQKVPAVIWNLKALWNCAFWDKLMVLEEVSLWAVGFQCPAISLLPGYAKAAQLPPSLVIKRPQEAAQHVSRLTDHKMKFINKSGSCYCSEGRELTPRLAFQSSHHNSALTPNVFLTYCEWNWPWELQGDICALCRTTW